MRLPCCFCFYLTCLISKICSPLERKKENNMKGRLRVLIYIVTVGIEFMVLYLLSSHSALMTLKMIHPLPKSSPLLTKNVGHGAYFKQRKFVGNLPNESAKRTMSDGINAEPVSNIHKMHSGREESAELHITNHSSLAFSRDMDSTSPRIPEVNYTLFYRKYEHKNPSNLLLYYRNGECMGLSCLLSKMPGATKELVEWAPEIFEKVPQQFLSNFKNPCWLRNVTELNCLPYFYMIGMFKCGTTDIWSKIVAHPDVVDVPKEPHWWGPRRHGYTKTPCHKDTVLTMRKITGGVDDSSFEWYLNLYKSTAVSELINNRVSTVEGIPYHPKIFGDASISTSYAIGLDWKKTFSNASEPVYTNAQLIRAVQPNAKIILMVRDPTERAISWYWHHRSTEKHNEITFHNFVVKNIGCLKSCLKEHNPRYCAYGSNCPYKLIPELQVGIYYVFARDWIEAFSRDGVLVLRLEDWNANPILVYRKIITFLGLRKLNETEEDNIIHTTPRNVHRGYKHFLPATKKILDEFFEPYNKEMSLLMNDAKFLYPKD